MTQRKQEKRWITQDRALRRRLKEELPWALREALCEIDPDTREQLLRSLLPTTLYLTEKPDYDDTTFLGGIGGGSTVRSSILWVAAALKQYNDAGDRRRRRFLDGVRGCFGLNLPRYTGINKKQIKKGKENLNRRNYPA